MADAYRNGRMIIINRNKLLDYLSDPRHEFLSHADLSKKVLGYKDPGTINKYFTPDEICEIEREALEIRRKKYTANMSKVDDAVLKAAKNGDVSAAKLAYQRFESWGERLGVSGSDGGPVIITVTESDKDCL